MSTDHHAPGGPWCARIGTLLLSTTLLICAALKAFSPYSEEYLISKPVYFGSATLEALLAVMLWSRLHRLALTLLVLALSGTAVFLWVGGLLDTAPCGCFGSWRVSRKLHFVLVGTLGMLAMATYCALGKPPTRPGRATTRGAHAAPLP